MGGEAQRGSTKAHTDKPDKTRLKRPCIRYGKKFQPARKRRFTCQWCYAANSNRSPLDI